MITGADIELMKRTLPDGFEAVRSMPVWIKAFEEYNMQHEYPISMNCRQCYFKVYKFHKDIFEANNN